VTPPDQERTARRNTAAVAHPHSIACPGFVRISDACPDTGQIPDSGHTMSPEERAALERALERSIAQADAGELIDADEVLAELQRP
jgi:hypothetical protein